MPPVEEGKKYFCFWEQRVMTYKGMNDKGEFVFEDEKGVTWEYSSKFVYQLQPYYSM